MGVLVVYWHGRQVGKPVVYQLASSIQESLNNQEETVCVFLDTGGASDNTHVAIKKALIRRDADSILMLGTTHGARLGGPRSKY